MGKRLVVSDVDFSANAIERTVEYELVNNEFTWGAGGIDTPGSTSGSINATMAMVGLPLARNTKNTNLVLVAANGYKIRAYLHSNMANPSDPSEYSYVTYSPQLDSIIIPPGMYYQIAIRKQDGTNADTEEGAESLLIQQIATPEE